MTDLEHDLAAAASRINLASGDLDAVTALARHRRTRTRRVLGGVTAAALVASIAAVVNIDPAPTPVASLGAVTRGDADMHWEVLSTSDGLGMGAAANGSGPFYALSTAPGRADVGKDRPSRVLYRSADGVEWTAASTLGNDLFLSDLDAIDGRVYAVGTAPAQAGVQRRGDLVAGWSDDGGKNFSKSVLPIDWNGIESGAKNTYLTSSQIASTAKGTVVTASVQAALDVPKLLPSGATAPDGWVTTDSGVDVLGPAKESDCPAGTKSAREMKMAQVAGRDPKAASVMSNERMQEPKSREVAPEYCIAEGDDGQGTLVTPQESRGVVRSYTWDELNVTGDLLGAVTHQLLAFFAPNGSADFTRVDLGNASADVAFLDADDSGFHLFSTSGGDSAGSIVTRDLSSQDGLTWKSVAGPSGLQWANAAGTVKGQRIVIGNTATGTVVARGDGNGGWVTTDLADLVDPAVSGGRPVHSYSAGVGPLGVVLVAQPEWDGMANEKEPQSVLVFSRDGETFEDTPIAKLAGRAVGVALQVFVSGQRAVVALSGGSTKEGEAPKPQTILVGTPA